MSCPQEVGLSVVDPSRSPLGGSTIMNNIKTTAIIPKRGVTRRDQYHAPPNLAAWAPTMYPRPLKVKKTQ